MVSANRSFYRMFALDAARPPSADRSGLVAGRHAGAQGCAASSHRCRPSASPVEDHEIEIELPASVGGSCCSMPASSTRAAGGPKILLAIDDITERRRAAEALEAAKREAEQANLGKSRFLAAASHDLRQPLQTLSLLQGILAKQIGRRRPCGWSTGSTRR